MTDSSVPVVWGDPNELVSVPVDHDVVLRGEVGDMVLVARKCPFRGGGAGGSMLTPCSYCGALMSSTAGSPHDGVWVTPMLLRSMVSSFDDSVMLLELQWFQP